MKFQKKTYTYIKPQYINTGKVPEDLDLFWHMFHNLTIGQNVWDCAKRVEIVSNWGERKSVASRVIDFRKKKRQPPKRKLLTVTTTSDTVSENRTEKLTKRV